MILVGVERYKLGVDRIVGLDSVLSGDTPGQRE